MLIKHHKKIGSLFFLSLGFLMLSFSTSEDLSDDHATGVHIKSSDMITAYELSEWIVEGRDNFQILELRKNEPNAASIIKGSYVTVSCDYPDVKTLLDPSKLVVITAKKSALANKAFGCLSNRGYQTALLKGGLSSWDKVLSPAPPSETASNEELSTYKKRVSISNFLQGKTAQAKTSQPGKKIKRSRRKAGNSGDEGC